MGLFGWGFDPPTSSKKKEGTAYGVLSVYGVTEVW